MLGPKHYFPSVFGKRVIASNFFHQQQYMLYNFRVDFMILVLQVVKSASQ